MPRLSQAFHLNFYGGEPLLRFPLIKKTVALVNLKSRKLAKRVRYSLTTNGSLLDGEIIRFLNQHKFSVELSFDGLVQNDQRKQGSLERILPLLKELLTQPGIDLEINSVFTPATVGSLAASMEFLISLGVPRINCSHSIIEPWNRESLLRFKKEWTKLGSMLLEYYKGCGQIPVVNFRENRTKGLFFCAGGKHRLAVTPGGDIWGCYLFPDYFKGREDSLDYRRFHLGNLDDRSDNFARCYRRTTSNYARLSMDRFSTAGMDCFLCEDIERCAVCPVNAAFAGSRLGKIPQYACQIQKIKIREKEKFRRDLQKIKNSR